MVRSMPLRGGRPQAPTAPTRRQLFSQDDQPSSSQGSSIPLTRSETRSSALQRRQALTTAGKAAVLNSGSVAAGRVRTQQDRPRPSTQQPGWVKKVSQPSRSTVNLSRSSLPWTVDLHPLTDQQQNRDLQAYETEIKGRFDRIVPVLKQVAVLQHEPDFMAQAQRLARAELGFDLPDHILEKHPHRQIASLKSYLTNARDCVFVESGYPKSKSYRGRGQPSHWHTLES